MTYPQTIPCSLHIKEASPCTRWGLVINICTTPQQNMKSAGAHVTISMCLTSKLGQSGEDKACTSEGYLKV